MQRPSMHRRQGLPQQPVSLCARTHEQWAAEDEEWHRMQLQVRCMHVLAVNAALCALASFLGGRKVHQVLRKVADSVYNH